MPYRALRCLSAEGTTVYALGNPSSAGIAYSRFCERFVTAGVFIDGTAPDQLIDEVNGCILCFQIDVVVATDGPSTRSLIAMRDRLDARSFPMPDLQTFDLLNSKWNFYRLCRSLAIEVPETRLFRNAAELGAAFDRGEFRSPQIAKPLNLSGGEGCIRIEPRRARPELSRIDYAPLVVQEFIEGDDIGASALCEGGTVKAFMAHRYRRDVYETFWDERIYADIETFTRSLAIDGLVNFDMRLAPDGRVTYLECNPRVFFKIAMSMLAGVNFLSLGLRSSRESEHVICPPATVRFPKALLLALLRSGRAEPQSWAALKYVLSDPIPYLREELGLEVGASRRDRYSEPPELFAEAEAAMQALDADAQASISRPISTTPSHGIQSSCSSAARASNSRT
jgi:predicted ATP-grasp superfamily ATP-dependent carboligase